MESIELSINFLKEINDEPIFEFTAAHSETIAAAASVALPILAAAAALYAAYRVLKHYDITPKAAYCAAAALFSRILGTDTDEIRDIENQESTEIHWKKTPFGYFVNMRSGREEFRFFLKHPPQAQITEKSNQTVSDPPSFTLKALPSRFEVSKKVGDMIKAYLSEYAAEIATRGKTRAPLPIAPAKREDYLVQAEMNWIEQAPENAKTALRTWEPFKRVGGRNEFDHKNSEILNQILRSLVILYSDKADWTDLEPAELLERKLADFENIKLMRPILDIIFKTTKFRANETAKKHLFEAFGQLVNAPEYQEQLDAFLKTPNATFSNVKSAFPLLYFAHAAARSMYLNVDLNQFQRDLIERHIVKSLGKFEAPTEDISKWSDTTLLKLDASCKQAQSWSDFFYIKSECLKGSAPLLGRIQSCIFGGDDKFHPANTNNCLQRLSTEYRDDKAVICLGMPVPTIDTAPTAAKVLDHLRLLLDYYKATGQIFFSFMHLKISGRSDGSINWETPEGMRAHALQQLADEYPGTYFYFSLPFDGALFAHPETVPGIDGSHGLFPVRSLKNKLENAFLNNKYGWYFPKRFWKQHGALIQKKYSLNKKQSPRQALFEALFNEIRGHFFKSFFALTREEWQVFQVLFGARVIECLSPFSDAFHNTCKDGIDRAAVYLLARRTLNLFRNARDQDPKLIAEEIRNLFVDYVKRAVAAKQQGPIPHRHEVAAKLLEIVENAGLLPSDKRYEIERDLHTIFYGAKEASDGYQEIEAGDGTLHDWPKVPYTFLGLVRSYIPF